MVQFTDRKICIARPPIFKRDLPGWIIEYRQKIGFAVEHNVPFFTMPIIYRGDIVGHHNNCYPEKVIPLFSKHYIPVEIDGSVVKEKEVFFLAPSFKLVEYFTDRISMFGGRSAVSKEHVQTIYNWPLFVSSEFTGRDVRIVTKNELEHVLTESSFLQYSSFFVKTVKKQVIGNGIVVPKSIVSYIVSGNVPCYDEWNEQCPFIPIDDNTKLLVSTPVTFEQDHQGSYEWRTWIINNKIVDVSKRLDSANVNPPKKIRDFAEHFIESHCTVLPSHYVLDIGIIEESGKPAVVELNNISSSGGASKQTILKVFSAYLSNN